jgi:hypothetical protein
MSRVDLMPNPKIKLSATRAANIKKQTIFDKSLRAARGIKELLRVETVAWLR